MIARPTRRISAAETGSPAVTACRRRQRLDSGFDPDRHEQRHQRNRRQRDPAGRPLDERRRQDQDRRQHRSAPVNAGGTARQGIRVDAGNAASPDDSVCLNITGNATAGEQRRGGNRRPQAGNRGGDERFRHQGHPQNPRRTRPFRTTSQRRTREVPVGRTSSTGATSWRAPARPEGDEMAEPFLAEIRIMSFGFPPKGWATCDGQLLPINQNQALFSLLGTTYGGDGRVNFAPARTCGAASPIHMGSGHTLGERGGEQAHTLSISEIPTHTHTARATSRQSTPSGAAGQHPRPRATARARHLGPGLQSRRDEPAARSPTSAARRRT